MRVTLIAKTHFEPITASALTGGVWQPDTGYDADALAEFAGRACYQSWGKPNPATARSRGYHRNTLDHDHLSIYEHASMTLYVEGVSRALTHELVRHRHLSFSQLSQRFVAEDDRPADPVMPPAVAADDHARALVAGVYDNALATYASLVERLMESGFPRKQAREAARAVLPNAQETKIVVTGNVRAWREFVVRRLDPHADAEIRLLASHVLNLLRKTAPDTVQDLDHLELMHDA